MVTATSATVAAESDAAYCLEQVRRFDRDRYLAALFARSGPRADLLALYAFNLELAKIRELVREPMMGLIRLQWWRDCIAEIYAGNVRRHQVAQPLAAAVARHGLPRESVRSPHRRARGGHGRDAAGGSCRLVGLCRVDRRHAAGSWRRGL